MKMNWYLKVAAVIYILLCVTFGINAQVYNRIVGYRGIMDFNNEPPTFIKTDEYFFKGITSVICNTKGEERLRASFFPYYYFPGDPDVLTTSHWIYETGPVVYNNSPNCFLILPYTTATNKYHLTAYLLRSSKNC